MRTITAKVKFKLILTIDEGVEVGEIINELEYNFIETTTKATLEDTELLDFEITDSR